MLNGKPRQVRKEATVVVMRVPGSGWQGGHPNSRYGAVLATVPDLILLSFLLLATDTLVGGWAQRMAPLTSVRLPG